ncbi:hypothetical protein L6164_031131 [Bauhinia variegata]|uniref:Uncharacterized protein n=1 Tax=Bauhinia variegata TaxID=167791 RepID=A0ACB9LEC4_BAUVA|nr:hypothetical protein L6164_031131 [Bauhinia variegata]
MADCEAPSFSLGLDLGFDSEPPSNELPPHSPIRPVACGRKYGDEDLGPLVVDSDQDTGPEPPARILKRLRRRPGGGSSSVRKQEKPKVCFAGDDDIEEFSSEEDLVEVDAHPSTRNSVLCSSSKVTLSGCGVLTPHSSTNWKGRKQKEALDIPTSRRLETGQNGLVFPKLTTSPLRRFQLLDSDSDDSVSEIVGSTHKIDSCSKEPTCNPSKSATGFEQNGSVSLKIDLQDLWKDFSPVKSFSIPTPAFNEVCEEYFRSTKDKNVEKSRIDISANHKEHFPGVLSSCQNDQQVWDSAYPLPPSHRYFFHEDPRIQKLVRNRLCSFSPLGVNKVNQQPNTSNIDYMGQFGNGGASKKEGVEKVCVQKTSTRGRNKSGSLTVEENFHASGGWVDPRITSPFSNGESSKRKTAKRNSTKISRPKGKGKSDKSNSSEVLSASANWVEPKSCANMPKDAGKRRVQASGQSVGHWYTGSDGRKVYVTRGGQELTGRSAYIHYRKESGSGFKKSKKKTSAKRKRN